MCDVVVGCIKSAAICLLCAARPVPGPVNRCRPHTNMRRGKQIENKKQKRQRDSHHAEAGFFTRSFRSTGNWSG
jgi:hypothetical protein